ncbi:uncharacterized protein LOC115440372 [Manduca sexta]|uniref:uncharacterized protein LOC115440372 n=1 Tax=Manduca sexta TaxID=7130 RepID=UPI00188E8828|nr:uncharacterized protein LOC115440372 [Manduca sexta]XP_030020500.2 uncharacterized protein LOC115440372 [Manduca sexta]XP_030020501.2 uncharacterized protein LOC115440372 [Manduca sexta]
MSSDIIACLQLDKELSNRVIVAKEINGCDSSFIVSCVLNHCVKNKHPVFILSTHHSLQHYQNISLKMNYNLQRHMDSGIIGFFNIGEDAVEKLFRNENNSLQELIFTIKENICKLQCETNNSVNIILDGVSHLFDLGYDLREVNQFLRNIIVLTYETNAFILCLCNSAEDDDATQTISNLLSHKADTVLEVENLPSGLSADVSGHLTIKHPGQKWQNDHMNTLNFKPSKYLFKLFDRGVKLLAPGTV